MITTTFPDNAENTKPFPKIMRSTRSGMIVLFEQSSVGTVIASGQSQWSVGARLTSWPDNNFEDYNGPVTLQNK